MNSAPDRVVAAADLCDTNNMSADASHYDNDPRAPLLIAGPTSKARSSRVVAHLAAVMTMNPILITTTYGSTAPEIFLDDAFKGSGNALSKGPQAKGTKGKARHW